MNKISSVESSRLTVTYRPLGDLIPDPRNARTHPKRQIDQIRASIEVRRIVIAKGVARLTPHDLRRTGATLAQAARLPIDFVKVLLNRNDKGVTGVYARWHMFEEKREAVLAIEAAVLPSMPKDKALAA